VLAVLFRRSFLRFQGRSRPAGGWLLCGQARRPACWQTLDSGT